MSETKLPCVKCGDRGRALQKLLEAAEELVKNYGCLQCKSCKIYTHGELCCPVFKLKAAVERAKGGGE